MFFSGDTIQNKIWKFVVKYKKTVAVFISLLFCFILAIIGTNLQQKHMKADVMNEIVHCQELEKENKNLEAYDKLQEIYKTRKSLIESDQNFQNLIDLYNYKLSIKCGQTKLAATKILNTNYVSQFYHYEQFSLPGELILLHKMIIHYENHEYGICEEMYNLKKMQKLPHFLAAIYRAKAMQLSNHHINSKDFLVHIFLYNHDYSPSSQFKELVKTMLLR